MSWSSAWRASSLAKAMLMSRYVVSASLASSAASLLPRFHTPFGRARSSRSSNCSPDFVGADGQLRAALVDATDQLRIAAQIAEDAAGVDPLGAERDEQLVTEAETGARGQRRRESLAGGARPAASSRRRPRSPACSPALMAAVAWSRAVKSGCLSLSTTSGTTTITTSLRRTASVTSVVADSRPAAMTSPRYSSRLASPGKGAMPALTASTAAAEMSAPITE